MPDSVVVSPQTFRRVIVPAFRAASATVGGQLKSLPVSEVDVLVDRSRLGTDPGRALAQSQAVAQRDRRGRAGPGLPDRQPLQHARRREGRRAPSATRMFLFLGLPGVLLAAFLAAYAGSILAGAQRREQANLRIRGAHRGHLRRMLVLPDARDRGRGVGAGRRARVVVGGGGAGTERAAVGRRRGPRRVGADRGRDRR